jgi:DHA1 family bicyclomycin/chloramphenicol resistance-like MFS transporter
MSEFPERTGAVSALIGAIQYGSGIVGSGLVGAFADGTPWPLGWVIGLAGLGSLFSMSLLSRRAAGFMSLVRINNMRDGKKYESENIYK